MSHIKCYKDGKLIGRYDVPYDMEVDFDQIDVYGKDLTQIQLRGKCTSIWFNEGNINGMDLSGFIELEIDRIYFSDRIGLLKILELNCREVSCYDEKLCNIMNKYLSEEPDPLMRDIQGCKYELAINGYGDRL